MSLHGLNEELSANHLFIEPRPRRVVDDRMVNRNDALAGFDERAQVIALRLADLVVHVVQDQRIVLRRHVASEGFALRRGVLPDDVVVTFE